MSGRRVTQYQILMLFGKVYKRATSVRVATWIPENRNLSLEKYF